MGLGAIVAGACLALGAASPPRRLRITNGCGTEPLWIVGETAGGAPRTWSLRIDALQHHDFATPAGPSPTRYWARARCDEEERRCAVGSPGAAACARTSTCTQPIDSKLDASFGDGSLPCDPAAGQIAGCDAVNVDLADGFTLPFRLERRGRCSVEGQELPANSALDCSRLSLDRCPTARLMSTQELQVDLRAIDPSTREVDLRAIDPSTREVVGCYGPCRRHPGAKDNSTAAADGVAARCCRRGVAAGGAGCPEDTAFSAALYQMCLGTPPFPRGDGAWPASCHASARYELTFFCPANASKALPPRKLSDGLGKPRELASAAEEGCKSKCSYQGKTASCKFRVGWALQHRFEGNLSACKDALEFVRSECPVCSDCSLGMLGCEETQVPARPAADGPPAQRGWSAPQTSAEAVQQIAFGFLTGPVAGFALVFGSTLISLTLWKQCRQCAAGEQQSARIPMREVPNGSQAGSPRMMPRTPGSPGIRSPMSESPSNQAGRETDVRQIFAGPPPK